MNKEIELEFFENPRPGRDYTITIRCPEFTSVCPKTGQPDFGEIVIEYIPGELCVELKSLKFYMQSYRNKGIFYEQLTNDILDDLAEACKPKWMKITSSFTPRGGITTDVTAEYCDERGKGAKVGRHKGTDAERGKGAKVGRHKGTEAQRHKD